MEVEWVDQQKINEFSTLNTKLTECERKETELKQSKEDLDDVEMEIELVDEDEKLMYKLGDGFVFLSQSEVMKKLAEQKTTVEGDLEGLESRKSELETRMNELKTELYAKFGKDAINLERE